MFGFFRAIDIQAKLIILDEVLIKGSAWVRDRKLKFRKGAFYGTTGSLVQGVFREAGEFRRRLQPFPLQGKARGFAGDAGAAESEGGFPTAEKQEAVS